MIALLTMLERNKIKPYCYILKRVKDNMKYFGVRWANVRYNRTPLEDFGIFYFSSSTVFKKDFKQNPEKFTFEITNTFDSKDEAIEFEHKKNSKYLHDKDWANKNAYPAILNEIHPMLGKKHSNKSRLKISKARKERLKPENLTTQMKAGFKKIAEHHKGKPSGMLGKNQSKEVRGRMSKSSMGNKSNTGRKLSEIHKKNIGKGGMGRLGTMTGKKHSKEALIKMSAVHKGNKHNLGNKASEETKLKMSLAQKKRFSNINERSKISEATLGKKTSEQTKLKMSIAQKKIFSLKSKSEINAAMEELRFRKFQKDTIPRKVSTDKDS
tara:strand:- start:41 stop:1015 length:975 start_codon:yes stop_codon:yes gene_type:complete